MLARIHRLVAMAWAVLATAAGLGFLARDLLGLSEPLVAIAWVAGALAALALGLRDQRA